MKSFKQFITEEKEEIIIPKVHMWAALLSGDYGQIEAALRSPHHTKEHIDWAMKHKEAWVVRAALQSPHHTKEHVDWAMKHSYVHVLRAALESPHHTKEHVDLAMKHRDSNVVAAALHSPHATKEQITDVVEKWSDKQYSVGGWLAYQAQSELDRRNNESQQS